MDGPYWLFLESTMIHDEGITTITPGDVMRRSMVAATDVRNVRLPDVEDEPIQRVAGTIRGHLKDRLICELDLPCKTILPLEPGPGQRHTPGDRIDARAMFVMMWPYEVEIFSALCPTHDLRIIEVGERVDSYRLDGIWLQVEAVRSNE